MRGMASDEQLRITEIYGSVQGESTFSGLPCVFVRLTGCDLRCTYCDSAYAFTGGMKMSLVRFVEIITSSVISIRANDI